MLRLTGGLLGFRGMSDSEALFALPGTEADVIRRIRACASSPPSTGWFTETPICKLLGDHKTLSRLVKKVSLGSASLRAVLAEAMESNDRLRFEIGEAFEMMNPTSFAAAMQGVGLPSLLVDEQSRKVIMTILERVTQRIINGSPPDLHNPPFGMHSDDSSIIAADRARFIELKRVVEMLLGELVAPCPMGEVLECLVPELAGNLGDSRRVLFGELSFLMRHIKVQNSEKITSLWYELLAFMDRTINAENESRDIRVVLVEPIVLNFATQWPIEHSSSLDDGALCTPFQHWKTVFELYMERERSDESGT